ncbi:hypothetical protein QTO34_006296 [Cnephaeus nilssonii]|uniref:Mitoregulin n=1 Tax=Cnephaeus nilssonii TaxID=3371016 RepID=A0AA40HLB5_CNENI|nr:hypothetical protein QTO34_006296 [Eptesicus nilssonii]
MGPNLLLQVTEQDQRVDTAIERSSSPQESLQSGKEFYVKVTIGMTCPASQIRPTLPVRALQVRHRAAGGAGLASSAVWNARRCRVPRRRPFCAPAAAMADVSERKLQLSVLLAFASGVFVGWQANRLRRRYLDWRKRRLQDQLAVAQKKLDLA